MDLYTMYGIFMLAAGVWSITMSFLMSTKNIQSAVIFKVIPFFSGLGCLYIGGDLIGLL